MGLGCSAGQADDGSARIRVPVGRAQAGEGGDHEDVTRVHHLGGEAFDFRGRRKKPKLVAKPLDDRAADEDAAFERVLLGARLRAGGRYEAVLRLHHLVAGMEQHEAAGAVGVFCHAGCMAGLAEHRGLLVAGHAGDEERLAEGGGRHHAESVRRRMHVGKDRARYPQEPQQLIVPVVGVDVEEKRARSVGDVGDVRAVAGELPCEPRVDRAEGELAALGARACAGDLVEQPGDFRAAEVRIDDQPGALAHQALGAHLAQLLALGGGATVLPHDGVVDRLAALAVPDDGGLPLVGHAYS